MYTIGESCHLKLVQFKLRTSAWMSTSMNGELLKGSNVLKTISSTRLHYWALQNDPSSCNNCLTAIIFKMCNSQCIENVSTSVLNHVCTVDNWHFAFLTLHLHAQFNLLTSNTGVPHLNTKTVKELIIYGVFLWVGVGSKILPKSHFPTKLLFAKGKQICNHFWTIVLCGFCSGVVWNYLLITFDLRIIIC